MWIRVYLPEPKLGRVDYGSKAVIVTDGIDPATGERKHYRGHVGYISPVAEFTPKTVQTEELRTDLVYRLNIYVDDADRFLKQGMPTTVKIYAEHAEKSDDGENCIETKDLVKTFAGGKTTAVDHLSLTIEKGQTVGLIGADGAGKTTLLRLIGGLLLPDAGSLSVCGLDPVKDKARLSAKIGYMPQKFGLYEDLTVRENLEFYADLKTSAAIFPQCLPLPVSAPFRNGLRESFPAA